MQTNITARRISIPEQLKISVNEKLEKLSRHNSKIEKARVIFSQEKLSYISEVVLTGKRFKMVCLEKEADLKASFDRCITNLESRLKKFRGKARENKRTNIRLGLNTFRPEKSTATVRKAQIIKVDSFATKPMSTEEAVLELNLLSRDFVVFRNSDSENINVLYRRKDGNFGLIES